MSASWLANELDARAVVRLRDVFSNAWIEAMRSSVIDYVIEHGDGDFLVVEPDRDVGSPAYQLASDPELRRLFRETAELRWPQAGVADDMRFAIPVRAGTWPKARSNLFHYDASVLTMIVPLFIPRGAVGTCGELAAIGNKRPFRHFVASHLVDTVLTHNSLYRSRVTRAVLAAPERYLLPLEPGDACIFWGYRTLHGNLVCAPGFLRAVLVLQYGQVHADSQALKLVWRFSRSRKALAQFQYAPDGSERSLAARYD
jgi:hypothetical protein